MANLKAKPEGGRRGGGGEVGWGPPIPYYLHSQKSWEVSILKNIGFDVLPL